MNNLAYTSHEPDTVAPKVEEILRKDLGANSAIPYTIENESESKTTIGSMLKDGAAILFGGKETPIFTINFEIITPRPAKILVRINKQGIGCHAGAILFTATLKKSVKADVDLEPPKTLGTSKFTGDPDAIGKLNANKDLLKRCDKFSKTKSDIGGGLILPRFFRITPSDSGSILIVNNLAKATSMGMGATTEAKEFFEILNLIESCL